MRPASARSPSASSTRLCELALLLAPACWCGERGLLLEGLASSLTAVFEGPGPSKTSASTVLDHPLAPSPGSPTMRRLWASWPSSWALSRCVKPEAKPPRNARLYNNLCLPALTP